MRSAMLDEQAEAAVREWEHDAWVESCRKHNAEIREALRWSWLAHEERMSRVHRRLAEEHEPRAQRLLEETG